MTETDRELIREALRLLDYAYHEFESYIPGFTVFWEQVDTLFNDKRFCELLSEFNKKDIE